MYDSGRWFRALLMGLTLAVTMWAINKVIAWKDTSTPETATATKTAAFVPVPHISQSELLWENLPIVAFDNTCLNADSVDISDCTKFLSGGEGRLHRIVLSEPQSLAIEVAPRFEMFDPGFSLYGPDKQCILGRDGEPAGILERALTEELPAGEYALVVGGYAGDCGEYVLTVSQPSEMLARLLHSVTHAGPNGVAVRWETFGERNVNHYVVYRRNGEQRDQVAVVRGRGSAAGTAYYRCLDRQLEPGCDYELVAVGRDGRTQTILIPSS